MIDQKASIIIGIDPGTIVTGYGIIENTGSGYRAIDYGCIRPPAKYALADRYHILFESLEALLEKHKPHVLAVETQYVKINVQSAIKLGMARGMAILAAKRKGLEVYEYAPTVAKRAVVGHGGASKQQVVRMVQNLLCLKIPPHPEDAADALALAICHAHAFKLTR